MDVPATLQLQFSIPLTCWLPIAVMYTTSAQPWVLYVSLLCDGI